MAENWWESAPVVKGGAGAPASENWWADAPVAGPVSAALTAPDVAYSPTGEYADVFRDPVENASSFGKIGLRALVGRAPELVANAIELPANANEAITRALGMTPAESGTPFSAMRNALRSGADAVRGIGYEGDMAEAGYGVPSVSGGDLVEALNPRANVARAAAAEDFGEPGNYTPLTLGERASRVATFIPETLLASAPDMVATLNPATLMGYIGARTNEVAETRAANDKREAPSLGDLAIAAPAATFEALLERFTTMRLLPRGTTSGTPGAAAATARIARELGIQGSLGGVEELAPYLAETVGTETGASGQGALETFVGGLVAEGGLGGSVQAGKELLGSVQGRQPRAADADAWWADAPPVEPAAPAAVTPSAPVVAEPVAPAAAPPVAEVPAQPAPAVAEVQPEAPAPEAAAAPVAPEPVAEPRQPPAAFADYTPGENVIVERSDSVGKFRENRLTRAIVDQHVQTGDTAALMADLAQQPDITDGERWLAQKLEPIMRDLGIKITPPRQGFNFGGAWDNNSRTLFVRQATPETVLHEALHGATSALIDSEAAQRNPEVRQFVSELGDLGLHLQASLLDFDTRSLPAAVQRTIANPNGPLANPKELLAYSMTNRGFQDFLRQLPAPDGWSSARNAWDALKQAIAKLFGATTPQQVSLLDAIIESGGGLVDFAGRNPRAVEMVQRLQQGAATGTVPSGPLGGARTPVRAQEAEAAPEAPAPAPAPEAQPAPAAAAPVPPAAAPATPPPPRSTSTKNAVRDAEREREGRDPIVRAAAKSNERTVAEAEAALAENPALAEEVVERVTSQPGAAVSSVEEAVLLIEKVRLRNQREAAAQRAGDEKLSPEQRAVAQREWAAAEEAIARVDLATSATGREWGRLGQFRQRMMREDFTLEAMERRARAVVGGPLPPEMQRTVAAQAAKIEALQKQLAEAESRVTDVETTRLVAETLDRTIREVTAATKRAAKAGKPRIDVLKERADAARERLKKRATEDAVEVGEVDQTQTPAFKRWFGDSKVVDANGKPLVVYHGTPHVFDRFKQEGKRGNDKLSYFSDDPEVASEYAGEMRYGTPNVIPAYISLQTPFSFNAGGGLWGSLPVTLFPEDISRHFDERNILRGRSDQVPRIGLTDVVRSALAAGYDGVIADNIRDGGGPYGDQTPSKVVVSHKPEQIKSATGNRGTFDPADPRIDYAALTDPDSIADAVDLGAWHIAQGVEGLADFTAKMAADLGASIESLRGRLPEIFARAQQQNAVSEQSYAAGVRTVEQVSGGVDPEAVTHGDVRALVQAHIAAGMRGEAEIMRAVHGDLTALGATLTERDVRRLFSEYGKATYPSKDEDRKTLRELRALVQMQESIDRLTEGLPRLKSGPQRDAATEQVRQKRAQLDELLRLAQARQPMTPERAATLRAERIRNLQARIAEAQERLDTGARPATKPAKLPDTEINNLREQLTEIRTRIRRIDTQPARDAQRQADHENRLEGLRAQAEEIKRQIDMGYRVIPEDGKPTTPADVAQAKAEVAELRRQRAAIDREAARPEREAQGRQRRLDSLSQRIADLQDMIATGRRPQPRQRRESDGETLALEQQRDELVKQLRDLDRPPRDPEAIYQRSRATSMRNQIAELQRRLREGDYSKPVRVPRTLTAENERIAFELDQQKRAYNRGLLDYQLSQRNTARRILDNTASGINLSRAIMTSFDVSGVLRQGGFVTLGHPVRAASSIVPMFKAFASEQKQHAVDNEIARRPNARLYQLGGLDLTRSDGKLSQMEEAYMSRWIEKSEMVPGQPVRNTLRRAKDVPLAFVRGSGRAYTTFLNKLRADSFDAMVDSLKANAEPTTDEIKAIASYINTATGRGKIGASEATAVGLNTVFFAPKLVASRFQLLVGQPLYGGTMATRKLVAQDYARFMTGLSVVFALGYLAYLAGDDEDDDRPFIEMDPRSSSFARMRFGDTFIDPLAGLAQVTTFLSRVVTGETKTGAGDINPLRDGMRLSDGLYGVGQALDKFGFDTLASEFPSAPNYDKVPYGGQNAFDTIANFLRSKLAPVPGAVVNSLARENVIGQKTTPTQELKGLFVPMTLDNVLEFTQAHGVPKGLAVTALEMLGMSVQYRNPASMRAPDYVNLSFDQRQEYNDYLKSTQRVSQDVQELRDIANAFPRDAHPADVRDAVETRAEELGLDGVSVGQYVMDTTSRDARGASRAGQLKRSESGNVEMQYTDWSRARTVNNANKEVGAINKQIASLYERPIPYDELAEIAGDDYDTSGFGTGESSLEDRMKVARALADRRAEIMREAMEELR